LKRRWLPKKVGGAPREVENGCRRREGTPVLREGFGNLLTLKWFEVNLGEYKEGTQFGDGEATQENWRERPRQTFAARKGTNSRLQPGLVGQLRSVRQEKDNRVLRRNWGGAILSNKRQYGGGGGMLGGQKSWPNTKGAA